MDLSVVIAAYKSGDVLMGCLESIARYNDLGDQLEVIVVDSSPPDATDAGHIAARFPWVTVLLNPVNGGFGQANNLGAERATGRYLLFLNPDTVLIEPIFAYAVRQFDARPQLGAFGLTLVDTRGRYTSSFGILPEAKGFVPARAYLPLVRLGLLRQRIFPWGADFFVRRDLFFAAGRFDEAIFLTAEEPDLVRRLGGREVRVFPKRIAHLGGHTTEDTVGRLREAIRAEEYYFRKHGLDYRRYALLALGGRLARGALKLLTGRALSEADRFLMQHYRRVLAD